ncbi:hypothetical protein Lepto7376_3269 [[Leptolyngbya] sp. PCC 7376]|uniref:DUF4335 domain-containing protein n=1 Tax=[Leptolyngbya] sp. PCC 7376 TaxID=111781 RepID=UPI00029EE8F1|nr:DUF4335 domain-containing protein [[Leptolyngbya] sp. PCC 7376]AFY39495.1 hypothetical protein Lepto7376_3269 [[Leptolyngbya] sp. PCC 7376]
MNILRQYSLPNCTLILEGFDDGTGDSLQTLAVLSNVECRFLSSRQVLNGGKVFFDHLVQAVSEYAQGLLSGMQHPIDPEGTIENGQVLIETIEPSNVHRVLWQQGETTPSDQSNSEVHLTTAELFDLTEAIDQFLADGLTLPNFVLPLTPLSKRYSIPEQSLAERVTPPLIGVSSFALTAFALFFAPVPEATRPIEEAANNNGSETIEQTTENTGEETEPGISTEEEAISNATVPEEASISDAELDELLNTVPEIDDSLSLAMMQTYLYQTLNEAWTDRQEDQTAAYRLSVATDGAIVGYQAIEDTPEDLVNSTPLPQLAYSSVDEAIASSEEVGQFKVVFDDKVLEVSPWNGTAGDISFDTSEVRGNALRELVSGVRRDIAGALETKSVATDKPLRYSIGVTDDGAIAFYISESASAEAAVIETPLPALIQPEAAGIIPGTSILPQEPLTQVNVVFQPNGVVEVSPWAGYR